jgi:dihydroorotate dehydrogenase electron transfer subunit
LKPVYEWVTVSAVRTVAEQTYLLIFEHPAGVGTIQPGQFCMLSSRPGASNVFLPRPFSYYRAPDSGQAQILFRAVGRATHWLAGLAEGDKLGVFGPLGNPFSLDLRSSRAILVGGGIGVPPLVMLAERLANGPGKPGIDLVYGEVRGSRVVDLTGDLPEGVRLHLCTEDGSVGVKGLVTDVLARLLAGGRTRPAVYTCGPKPMLAAIADLLDPASVSLFEASLEENMACGHGICMGCAVPVNAESEQPVYRLCCADGPVFNGFEVKWR